MAIKINRMKINNFKPFRDFLAEFNSPNLIVFDGPNGFGKTSFYDAIELLITGRLRRYSDLVNITVDRRQSAHGSPFLNDRSTKGDLVIKGELEVDGKVICLMRVGKREKLLTVNSIDEVDLPLYEVSQFDNGTEKLINNENEYLMSRFGKDYIQNFHFLNYIEQEENIYLLKKKDTDRKNAIAYLFNTSKYEERIAKLDEYSKTLGEMCGKEAREGLFARKKDLDQLNEKLTNEVVSIPYTTLISWKKIAWDMEKIEFQGEQYAEWLGENGELSKIEFFLKNIEEFKKQKENEKIDGLMADESIVKQILLFWKYLDDVEEYVKKYELNKSINDLLQAYEKGVLSAIEHEKTSLSTQIQDIIKIQIDIQGYSESIDNIQKLHKNANKLSKLLVEMKDIRQAFLKMFMRYEAEAEPERSCPLCGYSWRDAQELKDRFNNQENQIESLIKTSGIELDAHVAMFTLSYLDPVNSMLNDYLMKNPIDETFVKGLKEAANNRPYLEGLYKKFMTLEIDINSFLNDKPIISSQTSIDRLRSIVKEKRNALDHERLRPYFPTVFISVFDSNYDNMTAINASDVEYKRRYIESQYSLYRSKVFKQLETKCREAEDQFNKASKLKGRIYATRKVYEDSLRRYQQGLIESIEILFHIYSGRITQEGQGNLGLFIKSEKSGIRFLENHSKIHDAIFTMSSGQLAALVIAFTLALNKRYSKNKLLFIDDPIQTLDELNISGFVEILRNEFSDRQMFISTHEDMMSAYMRYKFDKYGLKADRINFKEKLLSLG